MTTQLEQDVKLAEKTLSIQGFAGLTQFEMHIFANAVREQAVNAAVEAIMEQISPSDAMDEKEEAQYQVMAGRAGIVKNLLSTLPREDE